MASVLRVRTYLFRLRHLRLRQSPSLFRPSVPAEPEPGGSGRNGSGPGQGRDDPLGRWEVDGGQGHVDG